MPHVLAAGKLHPAGIALLEAAPSMTFDHVTDPDPRACLPALPRAEGQNVLDHSAGRLDPALVVNLKGGRAIRHPLKAEHG